MRWLHIQKKIENLDKYGFFEEVESEGQETVRSWFVIHKEERLMGWKKIQADGLKRIIWTNSSWWAEKNYKDYFINRHQGLKENCL